MNRVVSILFTSFLFFLDSVSGQCIVATNLLKEIKVLRADTSISNAEKIRALPRYDSLMSACSNHFDSTHTTLLRLIGDTYSIGSDFSKSIYYLQKSTRLILDHISDPSVKRKDLPRNYFQLAVSYDSLHRIAEKINAVDSCIAVSDRLDRGNSYYIWALYERAIYSFDIGDYVQSLNYSTFCEAAAKEYIKSGLTSDVDYGNGYINSSQTWTINSMLVLKKFDEIQKLLEGQVKEIKESNHHNYLGVTYGQLGEVLIYKGDYENAQLYIDSSIKLVCGTGVSFNCKTTLNSIGYDIYFKHQKNYKKALAFYQSALRYQVEPIYASLGSLEMLNIYNRIANVFVEKGQYESAFKNFQMAFNQISPGGNESTLLQESLDKVISLRRIGYITALIMDKAEAYRRKFIATHDSSSVREAVRIYKIADQFLERIKDEQFDPKSKIYWRSDRRKLYEHAIEACYAYGNLEDAFYFFERSKAVLLYDQLAEQRLLGKGELIQQTSLKKLLYSLDRQLSLTDKASAKWNDLQQQKINAQRELDKLNNVSKAKNNRYYQSLIDVGTNLHEQVKSYLRTRNANLIEFYDGDSAMFVMILTPDKILLNKHEKAALNRDLNLFISYLSDRSLLNKDFDSYLTVSRNLYHELIEKYNLTSNRIIVSPDSRYFPVEALVTNEAGKPPKYFVETYAVSYTQSARFLIMDFNSQATASQNFLGLAPVDFNKELHLSSLLGSDKSLKRLAANFRGSINETFEDASRTNFLKNFGNYSILQLYTHATDGVDGGEPMIYFSDSVLYLSELVNEQKPATRLIVLSACETGKGQWYQGEGVFSFNRGFAALGVPSSITNLWSMENKSTYRLTELFYKYLARGMDMDIALQRAKIEFLEYGNSEDRMPCYWSAAILSGRTDAIQIEAPIPFQSVQYVFVVVIGLLTIFALWINYTKTNKIGHTKKQLAYGPF
jgi:CHAT domain-containing protein